VVSTGEIFNKMELSLTTLVNNVEEINIKSDKMKGYKDNIIKAISKISSSIEDVSATTEEVSASTEEQLATMKEVAEYASELNDIAIDMNNEVMRFKI